MNESNLNLLERTRLLLADRSRRMTLHQIAEATGLTYGFLHHFSVGTSKDPGVVKTQVLYEYLTSRKLEV